MDGHDEHLWLDGASREADAPRGPFGIRVVEADVQPQSGGPVMMISPGALLHPYEVIPAEHVAEIAPGMRIDLRRVVMARTEASE